MKVIPIITILYFVSLGAAFAQDITKIRRRNKVNETILNLPDMLVAEPAGPDSLMYFLKNDNLVLTVFPLWQEKGTQMGTDLKLNKINEDPFDGTFPLPDKKLANGLVLTLCTVKKSTADKKQMVLGQVKTHLTALYKEAGKTASADEITQQVNSMISGPETFTTNEGKQGEIYLMQDFQPQQVSFNVAYILPGTKPNTTVFVQFCYYKYLYDTDLPNDINELKVFGFPDDQALYVAYTKNFLKTLRIP